MLVSSASPLPSPWARVPGRDTGLCFIFACVQIGLVNELLAVQSVCLHATDCRALPGGYL